MMKHCKDLSCLDVNERSEGKENSYMIDRASVWEKIASQIPGKTLGACKQEGIKRLLKIYEERERTTAIGSVADKN